MDIHFRFKLSIGASRHPDHSDEERSATVPDVSLRQVLELQLKTVSVGRSASTMDNYRTAIRSLSKYLGHDIPLSSLDTLLITGYERWLKQQGLCLNTISCYMRSLRSLLALADSGLKAIFSQVYTGTARTEKRSVSAEDVCRLKALHLPKGSFLELSRDVFLFSFYAMGMPFVDVAHLRQHQIANGQMVYHRHKTGQRVLVAIEQPMLDIIQRHAGRATADYVFPLLHQGTDHEYRNLLGRYNRALHRLAALSGIGENLTSYVVRHTWASTAYSANVDLPVISKALGHINTQTTLTYIREIDDSRLAQANRRIIGMIESIPQE